MRSFFVRFSYAFTAALKIVWKLEEDDGVGFAGRVDIVLATWRRVRPGE